MRRLARSLHDSQFTIHNSQFDYVLLLNPDAEVIDDALYTMAAFLHTQPHAAVCGARLQYADGRFQHGAFRFPTLAQVALDFFPPIGLPGAHRLLDSRLNGRYPMSRWEGETPFAVDFVLGAAMMVRGAAIRHIGGLDDGYWMYCEEMDWCLRLRDAGWKTYAVPTAQVIHHEGQSSRQARWRSYGQLWRSRFRFYAVHAAHYPPGYLAALRVLVRIGLAYRRRQAEAAFARGVISGVELADELSAYTAIGKL